ncbi:MAG: ATP-binding cassette domain-containing protein, partial [Alphaproteobacteria bacterium]
MIRVQQVSKHFGGVRAVDNTTLNIEAGSITGLIGPNGAGKSSMLNVINGFYKPTSGQINFAGEDRNEMVP